MEKLKGQGEIENYTWMNEVNESGLPYDFTIQELSGNIIYLDVKSTSFDFNQRMIFSSQELGFICDTPNEYHIYRVYNLNGSIQNLRICKNYKEYASLLWDKTCQFTRELKDSNAILQTAKISVNPEISTFYFEKEIAL